MAFIHPHSSGASDPSPHSGADDFLTGQASGGGSSTGPNSTGANSTGPNSTEPNSTEHRPKLDHTPPIDAASKPGTAPGESEQLEHSSGLQDLTQPPRTKGTPTLAAVLGLSLGMSVARCEEAYAQQHELEFDGPSPSRLVPGTP